MTKLYSNVGICSFHLKEFKEAIGYFENALSLDLNFVKARVNLIKCRVNIQDWLQAFDDIIYIQKNHPQYFDIRLLEAVVKERNIFIEK